MQLGAFSVSLAVEDLAASKAFYEKLGFAVFGGEMEHNWLMMKNGDHVIGLFQGMFEGNILTFNPGLPQDPSPEEIADMKSVPDFTDVRVIEQRLVDSGIELTHATETEAGADHVTLVDPDGNQILIDQFF